MDRRGFLGLSGVALGATLAGCSRGEKQPDDSESDGTTPTDATDQQPAALSDGLRNVLGVLPRQADGSDLVQVSVARVVADAEGGNPLPSVSTGISEGIGVQPASVDYFASAIYGTLDRLLYVLSGEFDETAIPERGDTVTYAEDGLFIAAVGERDGWDAGLDAARATLGDSDGGLVDDAIARVLAPIREQPGVTIYPTTSLPAEKFDGEVEVFAAGRAVAGERTERVTYSVLFDTNSAASDELVSAVVGADGYPASAMPIEYGGDGRLRTGSFEQRIPESNDDNGIVTTGFFLDTESSELIYTGSEPLDTEGLRMVVDGDPVDSPWADRSERIDSQARFPFDAPPFSFVTVFRAGPPVEIIAQELAQPQESFARRFDEESRTLTIEYAEDQPGPTEHLRLVRTLGDSARRTDQPLSEYVGQSLQPDDAITVENVSYGEEIKIETRVETDRAMRTSRVFRFRDRPPGGVAFERTGDPVAVTYRGEEQPADRIQLRIGTEPTGNQFAAQYDRLSGGETIEIDAAAYDIVEAVWTGQEIPAEISEYTVPPNADLEFEYDRTAAEITVTHAGGEAVEVDSLTVDVWHVAGSNYDTAGLDSDDQLTEGDSFLIHLSVGPTESVESIDLEVNDRWAIDSGQFEN